MSSSPPAAASPAVPSSAASSSSAGKNRDKNEFPPNVRTDLMKKCQYRCCNPECGKLTLVPSRLHPSKSVNIGVLAHINSAGEGKDGKRPPRYDPNATTQYLKSRVNGILLCKTCEALIDGDEEYYTKELLIQWREGAEAAVRDGAVVNFWKAIASQTEAEEIDDDDEIDNSEDKMTLSMVDALAVERIRDMHFRCTVGDDEISAAELRSLRQFVGEGSRPYGQLVIRELLDLVSEVTLPQVDQQQAMVVVLQRLVWHYVTGPHLRHLADHEGYRALTDDVLTAVMIAAIQIGTRIEFAPNSANLELINPIMTLLMTIKVKAVDEARKQLWSVHIQSALRGMLKKMLRSAPAMEHHLHTWLTLVEKYQQKEEEGGSTTDIEAQILQLPRFHGVELLW